MDYSKKIKKNSRRGFPYVNLTDCSELEMKFIDWFSNEKLINETLGLLVLKLNILSDEENVIEFCCYNKEDNSFKCIINEKDIYYIRINNLDDKCKDKEIVVIDNDCEYTYKCDCVDNIELGLRVLLSSYKKEYFLSGVRFKHYLSKDYVIFDVDYMGYNLRFKVVRPDGLMLPLFDNNGRYSRYILDNEEDLISYLVNLVPRFNLVDIFETICRISLDSDISIYPEIYLDVSYGVEKNILDMIHLRYGDLDRFGITNLENGKSLFLNKDDSFEYRKINNGKVNFSLKVVDDKVNCNVSLNKNNDVDLAIDMIRDSISDAYLLKDDVKVLSRRIVGMNRK